MIDINISKHSNEIIGSKLYEWKQLGLKVLISGTEDKLHDFLASMLNTYANKTVTYYAADYDTVCNHEFFSGWLNIKELTDDRIVVSSNHDNMVVLTDSISLINNMLSVLSDKSVLVSIRRK